MSLYGDYIREREDFDIVESEKGFATYKINGSECYIRDIYVSPDFREENIASKMADDISDIARQRGCTHLTGTVVPTANGSTTSIKVLTAYGFRVHGAKDNVIIFIKELD